MAGESKTVSVLTIIHSLKFSGPFIIYRGRITPVQVPSNVPPYIPRTGAADGWSGSLKWALSLGDTKLMRR